MCYHAVDMHCLTTYNMKRTRDAEDAQAPEDVGQQKKCEQLLSQPTGSAAIPSSYLVLFPSFPTSSLTSSPSSSIDDPPHASLHQEEQKESLKSTAVRADPREDDFLCIDPLLLEESNHPSSTSLLSDKDSSSKDAALTES